MLGFGKSKDNFKENKPIKTGLLFKRGNELLYITEITIVAEGSGTDLMVFTVGRWSYCCMKSTPPLLFRGRNVYFSHANDQNTFDPETLQTLSAEYRESFVQYLLENPDRMIKTSGLTPDTMTAHDISQDVLTALLDEHTWLNLLKGAIKGARGHWLPIFVSGMGVMVMLLLIAGTISPDTISITIGGVTGGSSK